MDVFENSGERFEEEAINLRDYWTVIAKRKWMVMAITLTVFAIVTILSFRTRPTFRAKGTLLIEQEPNILSFEQIMQVDTFRDDFYQTQYKLLQSRSLAYNAIERLKLYENEEFVGKPGPGKKPVDKVNPVFRANLVSSFLGRLEVKPVRLTRIVEVNFTAGNAELAAAAVNALFDSFIDMNIQAKYEATEQATEFLTTQIADLRRDTEQKEKELHAYGAEKNIVALSDKETTVVEKLGELNRALTEAQIDRVKQEASYNEIKNASPDFIPEALNNVLIQRLREEYGKLSREYSKKQELYRPEYPEMQRLKTELDSAKESLKDETQNLIKGAYSDYQAAWKKEKSLEEVFNSQKQEAIQFNSNAIAYNSLKIEIENNKSLLESLLRRNSETGVAARLRGLRTSNIKIVDRAEAPQFPAGPKKKKNMLLALVIGLFAGIGLAFLFEYLDNTVKTSEDVEKYAQLPVLGIVPTFTVDGYRKGYGYGYGQRRHAKGIILKTTDGKHQTEDKGGAGAEARESGAKNQGTQVKSIELISHRWPKSDYAESYRSIRTSLLLSTADPNLKVIVITSALASEGKTATVSNLAVALAQAGKHVLILDADLRKPRQHRIFGIKNLNGLTNYLTANLELKALVKQTEIPLLYLINTGPVPPNPAELLGSDKMAGLIEYLKPHFHYILIDTPPMLAVSDALVLGPKLDGVVLIVQGEKTSREAMKRAKEKLDLLKIKSLGVVINNLNLQRHDYYYKRYYYHYYGEE